MGWEQGQRDPYREKILLCELCAAALISGTLSVFHSRYAMQATVTRDDIEPKKE